MFDLPVEHRLADIPLYHGPVTVKNGDGALAVAAPGVAGQERRDGRVFENGHVLRAPPGESLNIRSGGRKRKIATHGRKRYITL